MEMHRLGWLAVVLLASFAMLPCTLAESTQDPSDLFLKAFQNFQTAERLEREAQPRDALEKYRSAKAFLDEINKIDAEWQPLVVEYRSKKTQEAIARLEVQVASLPPPVEEGPEGPLPMQDAEKPRRSSPVLPKVTSDPIYSAKPTPSRRIRTQAQTDQDADGTSSREMRALRRQVEDLQRQNNALEEKLTTKDAQLQAARVVIDREKVNKVEAEIQITQLKTTLENTVKDGGSFKSMRADYEKRVAALNLQLVNARADTEVLQEENDRLLKKLENASTYITDSDAIRKKLLGERTELAEAREKAEKRTSRIKDNAAQIEKVTADNRKINAENKELKAKLAEVNDSMVSKTEFEKLGKENKALQKKATGAEAALEELQKGSVAKTLFDQLTEENKTLNEKLLAVQKTAEQQAAASAAMAERDKQIAALQGELNTVNDRLLEAQTAISRGEEQVRNLQKQYDQATGELAQLKINPAPTAEETNLINENELLRGIVLRQIKMQTDRDEAKKKLEAEVATLRIKNEVINKQLEILGAPILQLSPEERNLFKEPMALLSDSGPGTMEVSLAVAKPADGSKPEDTPAVDPNADALPDEVRAMIQQAGELFKAAKTSGRPEQNYAQAEEIYQRIVEKVPNNYVALSNLGAVQTEAGKLSAAEVALKKAITLNDKDSFAYTNLGIVYSRQGKLDEAIAALRQAVKLNDNDSVAHNYLGVCFGQQNKREEAEKELKRATEINPDYSDAHFNLAVIYATMPPTAIDLAKAHYAKATQLGAAPDASLERLIQ